MSRLAAALEAKGLTVVRDSAGGLVVHGATTEQVGREANEARIALTELVAVSRSLEEAFFELTEGNE